MAFSSEDIDLFYDLLWSLQLYVARQHNLLPNIATVEEYANLDWSERIKVRQTLWDNSQQIGAYVQANPDNLAAEKLAIIAGWQKRVPGTFIIERILKEHTIFISDENRVYGVQPLYEPFEFVLANPLPVHTWAVLLPFKGQITYDGMFYTSQILFGGNMKRSFKDTYLAAKRDGRIIVSLDADIQAEAAAAMRIELKDWTPQLEALSKAAKALRAQSGSPPTWGPAFSVVKEALALAQATVQDRPTDGDLWEKYGRLSKALERMGDAIERLR